MVYQIKKEQKDSLIKLVDKIAEGKPYLFHERELSKDDIEVRIIASSFTQSQVEQLEGLDLNEIGSFSKGTAATAISLFDD